MIAGTFSEVGFYNSYNALKWVILAFKMNGLLYVLDRPSILDGWGLTLRTTGDPQNSSTAASSLCNMCTHHTFCGICVTYCSCVPFTCQESDTQDLIFMAYPENMPSILKAQITPLSQQLL